MNFVFNGICAHLNIALERLVATTAQDPEGCEGCKIYGVQLERFWCHVRRVLKDHTLPSAC